MALVSTFLCAGLMNTVELCRYAYSQMQISTASQAGVGAALAACDSQHVPATLNCPGLSQAVNSAVHSTSLGSAVTLQGQFTEGFYCLDLNHRLAYVQDASNPPADCAAVANPSATPTLYLSMVLTYSFSPLFPGATVVGVLPQQITRTSWMRMT